MIDEDVQVYEVGDVPTLETFVLSGETVGTIRQGSTVLYVKEPVGLSSGLILVAEAGFAQGNLITTAQAPNGQQVSLSTPAAVDATLVQVGMLYDPPGQPGVVGLKVKLPDGTESTLTSARISQGRYGAPFTISQVGPHFYRFSIPGVAAGWKQFVARDQLVP